MRAKIILIYQFWTFVCETIGTIADVSIFEWFKHIVYRLFIFGYFVNFIQNIIAWRSGTENLLETLCICYFIVILLIDELKNVGRNVHTDGKIAKQM